MIKAYKYRIYPNQDQEILLNKHFGFTRLIYNLALETKLMAYNGSKSVLTYFDLAAQLTELKKEYEWLNEANSQSLQMSLRNLDTAFKNFFKGHNEFPKFKSKHRKQSFACPQNVTIEDDKIFIPKFKTGIEIILHRKYKGKIKTVTISKTPTGKYFASLTCDTADIIPVKKPIKSAVGIDMGIKTFAVLSDGTKFDNPKYLDKSIDKLKWLQRKLSKKKKGSNRYKTFKFRVAKAHEKVANQRKDFLHKASDAITKRFDTVCIENLQVSNMVKNHKLARSISDCGWGMFETFLKYKSEQRGVNVLQIGTFEPSSKSCPTCGALNHSLTLADREWICANCGTLHDRDIAAAINILNFGLRYSGMERASADVELPTLVGAMKRQSSLA